MRNKGIIITIIGLGLSFISMILSEGFWASSRGMITNIQNRRLVLWPGRVAAEYREPTPEEIRAETKAALAKLLADKDKNPKKPGSREAVSERIEEVYLRLKLGMSPNLMEQIEARVRLAELMADKSRNPKKSRSGNAVAEALEEVIRNEEAEKLRVIAGVSDEKSDEIKVLRERWIWRHPEDRQPDLERDPLFSKVIRVGRISILLHIALSLTCIITLVGIGMILVTPKRE